MVPSSPRTPPKELASQMWPCLPGRVAGEGSGPALRVHPRARDPGSRTPGAARRANQVAGHPGPREPHANQVAGPGMHTARPALGTPPGPTVYPRSVWDGEVKHTSAVGRSYRLSGSSGSRAGPDRALRRRRVYPAPGWNVKAPVVIATGISRTMDTCTTKIRPGIGPAM